MLQLLSIEWLKLKNYRTFWILLGLYLLSITGANFIAFQIQQAIYHAKEAKGMAEMVLGATPYSFPITWQMTSWISSFLLFIPGLIMIISVTNEYSYRTHRQNIIDGWTRREFIVVKIMVAVALALASTLMVIISAALFGLADGNRSFSIDNFEYIGFFFLQAISYIMVGLLTAVLFKRGGLAIGLYFLYSIIIENVIRGLLSIRGGTGGRYLPLQSTDELIPFPVMQKVQNQFIPPPNQTVMLVLALVYLAAYVFFTIRKFETDDL
jgi:ABC-2 type transport system permease protein